MSLRFILAIAFIHVVFAQDIVFKSLHEGVLEERLRLAHRKIPERFNRLKALFEQTGCPSLTEQPVKHSKEPNLICTIQAKDPEVTTTIDVGAHFDFVGGEGVIDNWTGAILLPSLSEFIREKPRRHHFHFIGFAAEEKGLLGSEAYLKSISKEDRKKISAVITMDSLGLTSTKWWPNSSNKDLALKAAQIAHAMNVGFAGVNVDQIGTTDSFTFHKAGIPVLSLHSITQQTYPKINSSGDVWTAVSWKDYYDTHRLISALLVYLDQTIP